MANWQNNFRNETQTQHIAKVYLQVGAPLDCEMEAPYLIPYYHLVQQDDSVVSAANYPSNQLMACKSQILLEKHGHTFKFFVSITP